MICKNPIVIILVGVSGSGKDTLINLVKQHYTVIGPNNVVREIPKAISWTTRKPRVNNGVQEVHGIDYYFIENTQTIARLEELYSKSVASDFHREVFYGIEKSEFHKADVVWCAMSTPAIQGLVDTFGKSNCLVVHVKAEARYLEKRLKARGDSKDLIAIKLEHARIERMPDYNSYTTITVNNNLDLKYLEASANMIAYRIKEMVKQVRVNEIEERR
jgi:guanylate kinase